MNILFKILLLQIYDKRLLNQIEKVDGQWVINYADFCALDKWTKMELGELGVQVINK
jgi:hypothetical protein